MRKSLLFVLAYIVCSISGAYAQQYIMMASNADGDLVRSYYKVDRTGNEIVLKSQEFEFVPLQKTVTTEFRLKPLFAVTEPKLKANLIEGINDDITLTYYDSLTPDLVKRLRNRDTLKNLYIKKIDLSKFTIKSTDIRKTIISLPLCFESCIIETLQVPTIKTSSMGSLKSLSDSIIIEEPIFLRYCAFLNRVSLKHTRFKAPFHLLDVTYNKGYMGLTINESVFEDEVYIQDTEEEFLLEFPVTTENNEEIQYLPGVIETYPYLPIKANYLDNNIFNKDVHFQNESGFLRYNFYNSLFKGAVYLSNMRSLFKPFYKPLVHKRPDFWYNGGYNILRSSYFNNCQFNKTVNLEDVELSLVSFMKAGFRDSLILFNFSPDTTEIATFDKTYFQNIKGKNVVIVNPEEFTYDHLDCVNYSANQLYFPFIELDSAGDAHQFHTSYNDFYINLQQQVSSEFVKMPEIKDELVSRFEHERNTYDGVFYWRTKKIGLFLLNGALELVVNHGYHGESNVALSAFSVIMFFALAYLIFFPSQIELYMQSKDGTKEPEPVALTAKRKKPYLLRLQDTAYSFVKCFWVSFNIFMTPKFTMSFFKLDKRLFWFFAIEWIIGLFVIVLFLIYIASKYSFVKALVGL